MPDSVWLGSSGVTGGSPTIYTRSILYRGNNRRVTRAKGAETTYYVNAANGDLLLEFTTPVNQAIQHFHLNGKRVASKRVQM